MQQNRRCDLRGKWVSQPKIIITPRVVSLFVYSLVWVWSPITHQTYISVSRGFLLHTLYGVYAARSLFVVLLSGCGMWRRSLECRCSRLHHILISMQIQAASPAANLYTRVTTFSIPLPATDGTYPLYFIGTPLI